MIIQGDIYMKTHKISEETSNKYKDIFSHEAKILVVDDNNVNLTVVKKLLNKKHINADTANCGSDAVKMASFNKYDIIFMDHLMPVMDGIETLRLIRSDDSGMNSNTPTIILTANTASGMKDEYLSVGFDDYLEKPAKPELLYKLVQKYIPDKKFIYIKSNNDDSSGKDSECQLTPLIKTINDICDEISTVSGIESCGSAETYIDVLEQYLQNGNETLLLIKQDLQKYDYHDYKIRVHSLKSTSSLVGAVGFSKKALRLEEAVIKGNTDIIIQETPVFINDFKKLLEKLSTVFDSKYAGEKPDEEKQPISKERFEAAISTIKEFVSVFDFDSADYVIKELSMYSVPIDDEDFFKKIKIMIKNVDHDDLMPILERRIP